MPLLCLLGFFCLLSFPPSKLLGHVIKVPGYQSTGRCTYMCPYIGRIRSFVWVGRGSCSSVTPLLSAIRSAMASSSLPTPIAGIRSRSSVFTSSPYFCRVNINQTDLLIQLEQSKQPVVYTKQASKPQPAPSHQEGNNQEGNKNRGQTGIRFAVPPAEGSPTTGIMDGALQLCLLARSDTSNVQQRTGMVYSAYSNRRTAQ